MSGRCPFLDASVAVHVDGDTGHGSPPDHLSHCVECRRAVAQARVLDAALAAHADVVRTDDGRCDALLAAAWSASGLAPMAAAARRPRRPVLAWAGWAAAILLAAVLLLHPRREPVPALPGAVAGAVRAEVPGTAATDDDAAAVRDGMVLLPATRRRLALDLPRVPTSEEQVRDASRRLADPDRLRAAAMLARARALTGGGWAPAALDAGLHLARLDAAGDLVESPHPHAMRALARFFATAGEAAPGLARAVLARARDGRATAARTARLLRGEPTAELVEWAVALDHAALERAVTDLVARRPELIDAAARGCHRRADAAEPLRRARLLLALWSIADRADSPSDSSTDAPAPGAAAEPLARARQLFGDEVRGIVPGLIAALDEAGSASDRARCLLALAVRPEPEAATALLHAVEGRRRSEAELAAGALAHHPGADTDERLREHCPRSRRPELVCIALLGRGVDPGLAVRTRMGLGEEDLAWLRADRPSPNQLAALARRVRPLPSGVSVP